MHSSGSITRKFGPSWKQSTGQTSTQSIYLHLIQLSVTTNAMFYPYLERLNERLLCHAGLQRTRQLREVMILAAGGPVGEELTQREFAAGKRQVRPWNLGFRV